MELQKSQSSILWRQVWGLSAILAAVMFSWMAYGLYQPKILKDLGFTQLATSLGIFQGLLGAVLEPLVGGVSDQIQRRFGSRLPIITTGVTLAGLIFVGTSILLQWQIPPGIRWIVPVLMTVWVMAMIIFRGPVVALLRQTAPLVALPKANMLLTVVFGLVGALSPLMTVFLNSIGGSIAFILGALALTIGAAALYSSTPRCVLFPTFESAQSDISLLRKSILFIIGLTIGIEINLLLRTFPQIIQPQISNISTELIVSMILFFSAISVIFVAQITTKLGAKVGMTLGLLAILICLGLLIFSPGGFFAIALILMAGVSFGLVFESQIPLVLGMGPSDQAGLATGLYFGGMGAAGSVISILLQGTVIITPILEFFLCAISFTITIISLRL